MLAAFFRFGLDDVGLLVHQRRLGRGDAVVAALVAVNRLVVQLLGGEALDRGPRALLLQVKGTLGDTNEAHLAPVLTPGVADDPIEALVGVGAPADDGDDVVDVAAPLVDDARF
eukprot:CAMPEP_0194771490 /NCGR_PEP_ID=MMETSP0323_2-20130528/49376_1 /TAXON_ID=2866 ORGANISM="Crypthecodinium cohnii, Strain Seligo" /NCGR_SAMPLE_ID=MMETSP0323_2 /ASSEMBLY_ACC=CAM_ASM_000346 /LENGTH=113 /DNA_ID=CAMNT_0039705609 /DNA_START=182 /DNA_END=520 /DNA_ORIENTATION=+